MSFECERCGGDPHAQGRIKCFVCPECGKTHDVDPMPGRGTKRAVVFNLIPKSLAYGERRVSLVLVCGEKTCMSENGEYCAYLQPHDSYCMLWDELLDNELGRVDKCLDAESFVLST